MAHMWASHYRINDHPAMTQCQRAAHGIIMLKTSDISSALVKDTRSSGLAVNTPPLLPITLVPTLTAKRDRRKGMEVGKHTHYGRGSQGEQSGRVLSIRDWHAGGGLVIVTQLIVGHA